MKTLWGTYKIQNQQAVEEEQLLPSNSSTKSSPKKGSFKSFLAYSQSTDNENEIADEYRAYC